jgi:hypothetical protein
MMKEARMRRRLAAVFSALVVVAAGSLVGATPAFAIEWNPICESESRRPNEIICTVAPTGGRDRLRSIDWFVDGASIAPWRNHTQVGIFCTAGTWHTVSHNLVFTDGSTGSGSTRVLCKGPRITNAHAMCSSGANRLQCSVTFEGGTPPIKIKWTVNGDERTFYANKAFLDISCPAADVYVEVEVTDATGHGMNPAGYCSCHGGPVD